MDQRISICYFVYALLIEKRDTLEGLSLAHDIIRVFLSFAGFAAAAKVEPKDEVAQEKEKISNPQEGVAPFINEGEKGKLVFKNGIVPGKIHNAKRHLFNSCLQYFVQSFA